MVGKIKSGEVEGNYILWTGKRKGLGNIVNRVKGPTPPRTGRAPESCTNLAQKKISGHESPQSGFGDFLGFCPIFTNKATTTPQRHYFKNKFFFLFLAHLPVVSRPDYPFAQKLGIFFFFVQTKGKVV